MGILSFILVSFTLNLDVCAASLYFGTVLSKSKTDNLPAIAGLLGFLQCVVFGVGYFSGVCLGSVVGSMSHVVGSVILLFVGVRMLLDVPPRFQEPGASIVMIYIGTAPDTLLTGVSFGTLEKPLLLFLIAFLLISTWLNFFALRIGVWLRRHIRFSAEKTTGLVLVVLGITELFGIL